MVYEGKNFFDSARSGARRASSRPSSWSSVLRLVLVFSGLCGAGARAEVGQVLQGAAAVISAGSPIAEAGIRASADVDIARINSGASITMTNIAANTTKYLSDAQAAVALNQMQTAGQINDTNQNGVTQRLGMQLSELSDARKDAYSAESEKMKMEYELQKAQIQLAYKQSADTLALAREATKWQLTAAGLGGGFAGTGSGLTVTPLGQAGAAGSTIAQTPPSGTAGGSPGVESTGQAIRASTGRPMHGLSQVRILAPRSVASSRLLASVQMASQTSLGSLLPSTRANSAPVPVSSLRGSTSGSKLRLASSSAPAGVSDLETFRRSVARAASSPDRPAAFAVVDDKESYGIPAPGGHSPDGRGFSR